MYVARTPARVPVAWSSRATWQTRQTLCCNNNNNDNDDNNDNSNNDDNDDHNDDNNLCRLGRDFPANYFDLLSEPEVATLGVDSPHLLTLIVYIYIYIMEES